MIDRLLDKLEPQRRHLAVLVGLLVLTFVLTAVLALQAQRSELARERQSRAMVQGVLTNAVGNWRSKLDLGLGRGLTQQMQRTLGLLAADAEAPTATLAERASLKGLCVVCGDPEEPETFFSLHPRGGGLEVHGEPISTAAVGQIAARMQAGQHAPLHDVIGGGIYFVDDAGRTRMVFAYARHEGGEIVRIIGAVVPAFATTALLDHAFNTTLVVPQAISADLPNSALFTSRAAATPPASAAALNEHGIVAIDSISSDIIHGLVLGVGVRREAYARFGIADTRGAHVGLLLALISLIGGLLVLALLLIRRESELVRLRADFISGVSHELRTPLAQIRMFTETLLLGRTRSDIERRRSLEIIDQEARRLTHLVENVLLFSKSEGGRRTALATEPTRFAGEIRHAVESFGPLCRSRDVEIRLELQEEITAPVDRCALRQILINLIDNALKYGPPGQRITAGVALFDDVARVWVDDEGPGIPVGERERVFDSFQRLRRELETRVTGSGIGLSVVRELARLHGGQTWAEEAPGGGARIIVEFPGAWVRQEPSAGFAAAS